MAQDVIPAQPLRRAFIQIAAATVVFILLTLAWKAWLVPWLIRYNSAPDRAVAVQHFHRFMWALGTLIAALALFPLSQAWRILRSGQAPPPGAWVFRDTPIHRGTAAKVRGFLMLFFAAALLACAIFALCIPTLTLVHGSRHASQPPR